MVAEKHGIAPEKAKSLGMLAPEAGILALGRVLAGTTALTGNGSVRGAAWPVYWHKLLANVAPTPKIFAEVMRAQPLQPTDQASCNVITSLGDQLLMQQ